MRLGLFRVCGICQDLVRQAEIWRGGGKVVVVMMVVSSE